MPRARLDAAEGKTTEWKSTALRAYQRRTQAGRFADCTRLACRHQQPSGAPGACRHLWRRGRQGYGEPGVAEDRRAMRAELQRWVKGITGRRSGVAQEATWYKLRTLAEGYGLAEHLEAHRHRVDPGGTSGRHYDLQPGEAG